MIICVSFCLRVHNFLEQHLQLVIKGRTRKYNRCLHLTDFPPGAVAVHCHNRCVFPHFREQRVITISKSEYFAHPSVADKADVQQVVMYCKEKLIRGDSEFSFEELRAQKYNLRRKHEQWGTCSLKFEIA